TLATWNLEHTQCHLLICNGGSCTQLGADDITESIRDEIQKLDADELIHTSRTQCNGRCSDACVVIAYPEGVWYKDITPESGKELVQKHLQGQRLDSHMVYHFDQTFIPTGTAVKGISKTKKTDSR
ncbi:hypothetical protein G195_001733, partial [Phytophthora kernoviae 00238/432]